MTKDKAVALILTLLAIVLVLAALPLSIIMNESYSYGGFLVLGTAIGLAVGLHQIAEAYDKED